MMSYYEKYIKYKNKYFFFKNNLDGGTRPIQYGCAVIFRHLIKEIRAYLWKNKTSIPDYDNINNLLLQMLISLSEIVHSEELMKDREYKPSKYYDPNYLYSDIVENSLDNFLQVLDTHPYLSTIMSNFNRIYTILKKSIEISKREKISQTQPQESPQQTPPIKQQQHQTLQQQTKPPIQQTTPPILQIKQ